MSTSPHQLFLLADHIKLSLLERQRAASLNLAVDNNNNKTDGNITRSLESLRAGLETLSAQAEEEEGTLSSTQLPKLRKQYQELSAQFHGHTTPTTTSTTTTPNDSTLSSTFAAAKQQSTPTTTRNNNNNNKSVRFDNARPYRDTSPDDTTSRTALFSSTTASAAQQQQQQPYTDNDDTTPDQSHLTNQQIHTYHTRILSDQDAQLDALSSSIGRQRLLGIQMGDEMDDQNALLDDVERGTDRFQARLDVARGRLGKVARKAKDNWSWVTIGVLILILVLLLVILN